MEMEKWEKISRGEAHSSYQVSELFSWTSWSFSLEIKRSQVGEGGVGILKEDRKNINKDNQWRL